VLNKITDLNAFLYGGVLNFGATRETHTFTNVGLLVAGEATSVFVAEEVIRLLLEHNNRVEGALNHIGKENGIEEVRCKALVAPVDITLLDLYQEGAFFTHLPPPVPIPGYCLTSVEPIGKNWAVQSRVVWQTKKEIIGGDRLGIVLPDIVARARAEIQDEGELPTAYGHDWRVRLVQPKEDAD